MSRIPKNNEYKYRTIRRGLGSGFILDEVWEQQLRTHLQKEYANERELEHAMKLTGIIEVFNKNLRLTATRADMVKLFRMSEQSRWDRKYPLTKAEAKAKLYADGLRGDKSKPKLGARPSDLKARGDTRYYRPRPGSSAGKISTSQIGHEKVYKKFEELIRTLFSIGQGKKGKRVKTPGVSVSRIIKTKL